MRRIERWHVLAAIGIVAGAVLWLLLVPSDDPSGNARNAAYWLLVPITAVVLGALAPNEPAMVGASVVAPALLLAGWTAPQGDGDGLWVLWFPLLGVLMATCAVAGGAGGWLGAQAAKRRPHP